MIRRQTLVSIGGGFFRHQALGLLVVNGARARGEDGRDGYGIYHPRTRARLGSTSTQQLARAFCRGFENAYDGVTPQLIPRRTVSVAAAAFGVQPMGEQDRREHNEAYLDGYAAGIPYNDLAVVA